MILTLLGLGLLVGVTTVRTVALVRRRKYFVSSGPVLAHNAALAAEVLARHLKNSVVMAWPNAKGWSTVLIDNTGGTITVGHLIGDPIPWHMIDSRRYTAVSIPQTNAARVREAAADGYKLVVAADGRVGWASV